jgi:hypothetical protein
MNNNMELPLAENNAKLKKIVSDEDVINNINNNRLGEKGVFRKTLSLLFY